MAILTDPQRLSVWAAYQRDNPEPVGVMTKADLRAAVNAADDWAEANAVAFNTALPQPARGVLTARQKARLLRHVIAARFEVT